MLRWLQKPLLIVCAALLGYIVVAVLLRGVGLRSRRPSVREHDVAMAFPGQWRRVLLLIGAVACLLWLTGCSGSGTQPSSARSSVTTSSSYGSGPTPNALARWLHEHANPFGSGRATSADWVTTTHGQAATIVSGGGAPDPSALVYLVDFHGNFVWNHSCPPGAPPSACVSRGRDAVFTLDPKTLDVMDFGVENTGPHLADFGTVAHVTL